MITRLSPTAHAAYLDLLWSLRGTPGRVERNGRAYWFDSYRVGTDVRKAYIGEETPELPARLDNLQALRAGNAERRAQRTRLVRFLRAEG